MKLNALIIEAEDNVAIAIEPLSAGDSAVFQKPDGSCETITILTSVPIYHKFALTTIPQGEKIIKYGEHIGEASVLIQCGEHVHTHNVASVREELA